MKRIHGSQSHPNLGFLSDDKGAAAKCRLDRAEEREAIQSQIAQFQVMRPLEITKILNSISLLNRFAITLIF